MKIGDFLKLEFIVADLRGADKAAVLQEMAEHTSAHAAALAQSAGVVFSALQSRERLGSTGVGEGVAIPHAKIPSLKNLVACFGRKAAGIGYDAVDAQPVSLIFMLLVPENSAGVHLKALARVSRLLKSAAFRDVLLRAANSQALYEAFVAEDDKNQNTYA